ncbi:MAG: carboxylating nicotinate-nucleotide diphosphorylase [Promethearchaeota archaeon]
MFSIPKPILLEQLRRYLDLDIGFGDLSSGFIPKEEIGKAKIISKSHVLGIVAGAEEANLLFEDAGIKVIQHIKDGEKIKKGDILMELEGNLRNVLAVERTALNFLMKLSSIATSTYDLVQKIQNEGLKTKIAATRKTTPGFGWFEKKAVYLGGGDTHRWNLSDMVMFKDTHLKFYKGDIGKLLKSAKNQLSFSKKIEIEIEKAGDIIEAAENGADVIMFDNMSPDQITDSLSLIKDRSHIIFEASGNIDAENLLDYAKTGVDIISTSSTIFNPQKKMDYSLKLL